LKKHRKALILLVTYAMDTDMIIAALERGRAAKPVPAAAE
jgi:hypothetical protein